MYRDDNFYIDYQGTRIKSNWPLQPIVRAAKMKGKEASFPQLLQMNARIML
jgi:hypothetical protein